MDLTGAIKSAENQYKQILEDFFVSVYNKHELPSHGLEHHRRVWNFAKELVTLLSEKDQLPEQDLPQKLIIATYLHDIGMVIDHSPEHGIHSVRLCKDFLVKYDLDPGGFPGLLQAIFDHDKKDYSLASELNLRTILSIADDLDAFGFTGIYRYIEIYASRGIKPHEMSSRIRSNAHKRYEHFAELFRDFHGLVQKHTVRYNILEDFFRQYEEQGESGSTGNAHATVVKLISEMGTKSKDLESLARDNITSSDPIVKWFFEGIRSER